MTTTEHSLHLPARYRESIAAILRAHMPHAQVLAYGSRVKGDHHEASDLDLVARFPESLTAVQRYEQLAATKDALSESDVPILVQIVDWRSIPTSFHDEITASFVVLQVGLNAEPDIAASPALTSSHTIVESKHAG
jgi:predicted nucleotidyltransferase